jgi:FtsP/CotA-like multicopper oxidase with cupredoxin domain
MRNLLRIRIALSTRMLLALLACVDPTRRAPAAPLPEIAPATDLDPDPDVLEVELIAREAEVAFSHLGTTDAWTWVDPWGGPARVPGPLLDLAGASRLVVHVTNELSTATTLHVHGLRLPAGEDGTMHSQLVIYPGETYDYQIDVRDEGLAWYHPHVDSHLQVERGLYGLIRAPGGNPLPVDADRVIALDDIRLLDDGTLDDVVTADDVRTGRIGDRLLVNGAPAGTTTLLAGRRERWRLLNAANARTFLLGFGPSGATVIAHEGGTLASATRVATVLLAPGDRIELVVDTAAGERFDVEALPYDSGAGAEPEAPEALFSVEGVGGPDPGPLPRRAGRPPLVAPDAPVRELHFQRLSSTRYGIDDEQWPFDAPLRAVAGSRERWRLVNETELDLPFHLHGTFFQVETRDGAPVPPSWEDVTTVPPFGTAEILVPFDEPGSWMFHSHILEHAELGMMGAIDVVDERVR